MRACPANAFLLAMHACLSISSKCNSVAPARRPWLAAVGACRDCALVVVPCLFSDMVVTFHRHEGYLVFCWSEADLS